METFSVDTHLKKVYANFPEAKHKPVIGLTANCADDDASIRQRYYEQVVKAGGIPFIIPPVADTDIIANTLDRIDGLILTGGADINPLWCGEEPSPALHHINRQRDLAELLLTRLAYNRQIPVLGICRGIQTLTIALGGKVEQDIQHHPNIIKHSQDADRTEPTHSVHVLAESMLADIYGLKSHKTSTTTSTTNADKAVAPEKKSMTKSLFSRASSSKTQSEAPKPVFAGRIFVNSFHHQAVSDPGQRLRVTAIAPDHIIEAVESTEHKPILGVQWHPEWLGNDGLPVFQWLVDEARTFLDAKEMHDRILTLDTHCDTPMFFPQGVQFNQRDPRILYDLHKMTEGRQDAVIMVAYLPQPKLGETFSQKVDIAGIRKHNPQLTDINDQLSPTEYADLIFDKLEQIAEENSEYISLARTAADLYEDKRRGRKSIMFGIENGLALNHDLANVRHFAQRGVVYITLCHNGDNDICDSARGCDTNNGVSPFGHKVIEEMNRQGIMVDLSHAAEKSFYDALDISRQPIVCSHACCRALCDHPRNLTDEQMRALAQHGGVMQITLYHGFLRLNGEASILDAIAHLEHAIDVMGIDNVGIGTDFDGDGGVKGMADASEMINLTRHLLRRGYSERDIAKIWGGNWLRVMTQVQNARQS